MSINDSFDFKNPDYQPVIIERAKRLNAIRADEKLLIASLIYYKENPIDFIEDWFFTYDPRLKVKLIPFLLFPKQKEFIRWLKKHYENKTDGLVEKTRDAGATWLSLAFGIWLWRFHPGSKIGVGSRKSDLVDNKDDPDSIFEKVRIVLRYMPEELLPPGFNIKKDTAYMKIINRSTGSSIVGEGGDNIGRGGRSSMYIKDESAHYEHAERIDAALSLNSDVKIDISSVNGIGNPFYIKRFSGNIDVFVFDWRDDPRKDQDWYDYMVSTNTEKTVAQEIDRDYSASVAGVCIPAKYVKAAINLKLKASGKREAGLDVGDENGDDCSLIIKHGVVVLDNIEEWNDLDTTQSARRAYRICSDNNVDLLKYDSIGLGAGIKGETNELKRKSTAKNKLKVQGVNVGLPPTKGFFENDKKNSDMFVSYKAQLWWEMRRRFVRTYQHVNGIKKYPLDQLISIPNDSNLISELSMVKVSENEAGKITIETKKQLASRGISSPNTAEALIILFGEERKTTTESMASSRLGKRLRRPSRF